MTNLIEKTLILGFGIFTLIVFISFTVPIFIELESIQEQKTIKYNEYIQFRLDLEGSLINFQNSTRDNMEILVKCPGDLNITFKTNYILYYFLLFERIHVEICEINGSFISKSYNNLEPINYVVHFSLYYSNILVDFVSSYE